MKQNKSSSLYIAHHHLLALDLVWASFFLRVQLISPPLDLAWTVCWSAGLKKKKKKKLKERSLKEIKQSAMPV